MLREQLRLRNDHLLAQRARLPEEHQELPLAAVMRCPWDAPQEGKKLGPLTFSICFWFAILIMAVLFVYFRPLLTPIKSVRRHEREREQEDARRR